MEDRISLLRRRDAFKKLIQHLQSQYEGLKAQLGDNETYTQVRTHQSSQNNCLS